MKRRHCPKMRGRSTHAHAIAVGLALLALAACGGDDDATATEAPTVTATANVRFERAAWNEYVKTREKAQTVNERAIKTFRSCRELLFTDVPVERVKNCLATSAEDVVAEGKKVVAVLDDLATDVSGACADATADLSGNVKLYSSTVNAILLSIEQSNLPTSNDIQSSLGRLTASRAAAAAFERTCKPR
jgi:hypothetical protein